MELPKTVCTTHVMPRMESIRPGRGESCGFRFTTDNGRTRRQIELAGWKSGAMSIEITEHAFSVFDGDTTRSTYINIPADELGKFLAGIRLLSAQMEFNSK